MRRRDFLATSIAAAALPTAAPLVEGWPKPAAAGLQLITTLAGRSLKDLKDQYRRDLFDDFLTFMDRHVIDHEYGGFRCNADHTGHRSNENKSSSFEGRGVWVYSFLYNHLAQEDKYLAVARRSVEFILKSKPDGDGLWPTELSREGRPLALAGGEIYGDLYIAEGLSEYAHATGEQKYERLAKGLLIKCLRLYDRPDYRPTIGQTYLGPQARLFSGARIQGVWMVLIRLATQMLQRKADAEIERIAARCVDAVMNHHYNPVFAMYNELLNHDLSRPANDYAQLVYTGHALEISWMLLAEALRRKDKKLFDTVAERFKRHAEVAWDDVYGGVLRNLQNVEQNVWSLDKVLWAQEEVLIGALMIVEHTGAKWAQKLFGKMFNYVQNKYPLKWHGSPLWIYAADRQVTYEGFLKLPARVENFHHPRHLMLNLLALERIDSTAGRVSDNFS